MRCHSICLGVLWLLVTSVLTLTSSRVVAQADTSAPDLSYCDMVRFDWADDGTALGAMSPRGVILADWLADGGGTSSIDVFDEDGQVIAGSLSTRAMLDDFRVWLADEPLTPGVGYEFVITGFYPAGCPDADITRRYPFTVVEDPERLPAIDIEVHGVERVTLHDVTPQTCCDPQIHCTSATSRDVSELYASRVSTDEEPAWLVHEFHFFHEGVERHVDAVRPPPSRIVASTFRYEARHGEFCVRLDALDPFDGTRLVGELICETVTTSQGIVPAADDGFCEPLPDGADTNSSGDRVDDCACAVRGGRRGSSRLPLGMGLLALLAGLVWRRRRRV